MKGKKKEKKTEEGKKLYPSIKRKNNFGIKTEARRFLHIIRIRYKMKIFNKFNIFQKNEKNKIINEKKYKKKNRMQKTNTVDFNEYRMMNVER